MGAGDTRDPVRCGPRREGCSPQCQDRPVRPGEKKEKELVRACLSAVVILVVVIILFDRYCCRCLQNSWRVGCLGVCFVFQRERQQRDGDREQRRIASRFNSLSSCSSCTAPSRVATHTATPCCPRTTALVSERLQSAESYFCYCGNSVRLRSS